MMIARGRVSLVTPCYYACATTRPREGKWLARPSGARPHGSDPDRSTGRVRGTRLSAFGSGHGRPDGSREAPRLVLDEYREPHEATDAYLVWHGVGPWKRSVASKTFWEYRFPARRYDSVESVLDYRIPARSGEVRRRRPTPGRLSLGPAPSTARSGPARADDRRLDDPRGPAPRRRV